MDFSKNIPRYLVEKGNLVRTVVFAAIFSLLFINLYQPYGSREWLSGGLSDERYLMLSSLLILIGLCVVALSRIIMYKWCKSKGHTMSLWNYCLWIAAEIVCVSFAFTLLEIGVFHDTRPFGQLLRTSFGNTALILLLPYALMWLWLAWRDKDQRLKAIAEARTNREALIAKELGMPMISFFDNKGVIKLSIKLQDLIYIKGADNYLTIHYQDGDHLGSAMVRTTFKAIEADMREKGIVRCHRSYMVNRLHIKLFEKSKEGFVVKLDTPAATLLPVTKAYVNDVFELFG